VLNAAQERAWLIEQLQPGTAVHNVAVAARLQGDVDVAALRSAVADVCDADERLRLVFADVEGRPVAEPALVGASLEVCDTADEGAALEALQARASQPLSLKRPLFRAVLGRAPGTHVLLLLTHELAVPREEAPNLMRSVAAAYAEVPGFASADRSPASDDTVGANDVEWFRTRFAGVGGIDLPSDRPRPAIQSFGAGSVERDLARVTADAVSEEAGRLSVELESLLMAAFCGVLFRYGVRDELVLGLSSQRRLPLRVSLSDDATLADLARQIDAERTEVAARSATSLEELIGALELDRDLSRSPLYQVACGLEAELERASAAGVEFVPVAVHTGAGPLDLELTVRAGDRPRLACTYAADLYEPDTIVRLLGHFETLLAGCLRAPDVPVARQPLLSDDERTELLHEWNATAREYDRDSGLHELVAAQARSTPDRIALAGAGETLTYAELERRSNQLGHELAARGVGDGTLVGVCVERTTQLLVALLGVLKTGAAYVPIDPSYPAERVAYMLADAAAPVLISETSLVARLPETDAEILQLDGDATAIAARDADSAPELERDPERLAYVIYTSGSTGRPKGVEIRHRSVVNLLTEMRERPGCAADDVVVNLTTFAFDLSVPDLYLPLVCGATLVVLPQEATVDGVLLAAALDEASATFVQATPTTWQMLVDSHWRGRKGLKIVCGGEATSPSLVEALLQRGDALWHMYGPTETTVWSSIHRLDRHAGSPPIGGPIANTRFYLLDESLQPVPVGVPAQLYIGGDGVARGYRGRADLTAEKFVPDPFAGEDATMYATGDLLRLRADRTLEFSGRIDHQIKLRGFRIELGEIESVLSTLPGVAQAVVIVREDRPGDRRLVAYVVPDGEAPAVAAFRAALAERLPPYMVPSAFVLLDELPATVNRKIDRTALPAPDTARPDLAPAYVAPRTPVEELVADAWSEVLGLERIGIDDNFFELGGSSLLATQVLARLARRLGLTVPLRTLFELPTVRGLSGAVVSLLAEATFAEDEVVSLLTELERSEVAG
jgi:amino acid adenylation domain-containing protein